MAVSDGETDHRRQGHGPGVQRVRRPHAGRRSPATSPSATPATRPPGRAPGATPSPSTATSAPTPFALGHNGNLANTEELAAEAGMLPGHRHQRQRPRGRADRPRAGAAIPRRARDGRALERALVEVLPTLEGAFSFVLMDEGHVIGVRDPNGFRPLCLGKLDNGWVLASETPALDVVGAHFVRELEPGEMVIIDASGYRSVRPFPEEPVDPKLCLFEFVYFARPDTQPLRPERAPRPGAHGRAARRAGAGRGRPGRWASPSRASPRPRATPARSGIPYGQGLVKNRYIGRTFIAPNQEMRALGVRMKLNPLRDNIAGQAAGRGRRLDRAGHHHPGHGLRCCARPARPRCTCGSSSPPYAGPASTAWTPAARGELLAANLTVERDPRLPRRRHARLPHARPARSTATGAVGAGFCDACLTGEYPVEVPVDADQGRARDRGRAPRAVPAVDDAAVRHEPLLPADDAERCRSTDAGPPRGAEPR